MAVTLVSEPGAHQPAYNPIEFSFSSTNVTKCDFVFIGDVYVNGTFAIRLKSFPDINGIGTFKLERVLQDFVSYNFNPQVITFASNPQSICDYQLKIMERYNSEDDCTGTSVLSSILLTTDKKYSWNGALQYHEFPSYVEGDLDTESQVSRFLTNAPDDIRISLNDYFTLKIIQGVVSGAGISRSMVVRTYSASGTLLGTFTKNNSFYNTTTTGSMLVTVPIGPKNIDTFVTIGSNVAYYTVVIKDNSGLNITETRKFIIDNRCEKFKSYRFFWLNRLGGFDAITFYLRSFRKLDITKSNYTKLLSTGYTIGERGDTIIGVTANESYTSATDWLSEDESKWVEELFTSPEVYVYESSDSNKIKISSAACLCPATVFNITGANHNTGGTANFFIDDSAVGTGNIPSGTAFTYTGSNFSPIGTANSGSGSILGYNATDGYYTTTVVSTVDPHSNITVTATLSYAVAPPCTILFVLPADIKIPIGDSFTYVVDDGTVLGFSNTGSGTVTGYTGSPGEHETTVVCTHALASIVNGYIIYDHQEIKLMPIIITNTEYDEQIKDNVKNIQYTMEFKTSYSKNVQN